MFIPQKIARYLDAGSNILLHVFGKEKNRQIARGLQHIVQMNYSFGVKPLTMDDVQSFSRIYTSYISTKHNPRIADLLSIYRDRIGKQELFFGYILDADRSLLAAGIFARTQLKSKDSLMLSYRAVSTNTCLAGLGLGYYIEYLFFSHGLSLGVEQFSRGRDMNGYGLYGSSLGLPIHKIQLKFVPYCSFHTSAMVIDPDSITTPSLFFAGGSSRDTALSDVLFYIPAGMSSAYSSELALLYKRGFSVALYDIL